jgi:hypothetical protein
LALLVALFATSADIQANDSVVFTEVGDFSLVMNGIKLQAKILTDDGDIPLTTTYTVDEWGILHFSSRLPTERQPVVVGVVEEYIGGGWLTKLDNGPAHAGDPFNWQFVSDGEDPISMAGCECSNPAGEFCDRGDCQGTPTDCSNGAASGTCTWNSRTGDLTQYKLFGDQF